MLETTKRLLGPLIPLVALPILYLGEVMDAWTANCLAIGYMFVILVNETPKGPWRNVIRIMVPQLVVLSAIYSNVITTAVAGYSEVFWIGLIVVYAITGAGRRRS